MRDKQKYSAVITNMPDIFSVFYLDTILQSPETLRKYDTLSDI